MQCLFDRRTLLQSAVVAGLGKLALSATDVVPARAKKSVAAIVTVYRKNSHADVIVGKILEGWEQKGGPGPQLELASLYVEQFPQGDMAKPLSEKHGFPIYDNIADAITLGKADVSVDAVLSIGEHGDYPWNDLGQHLYPRRRFFKAITDTFEKFGTVVPVFNDKHPGPVWKDALWMYERAKQLNIPWMAGSSLPVSFRKPDFSLPMHSDLEACLGIGYSGLDVYGFHTLEYLQCLIERRKTSQQGVRWVQSLPGSQLPKLLTEKVIRPDLLEFALKVSTTASGKLSDADHDKFTVFLIQYMDGLLAPVLMLPGYSRCISAVVKPRNRPPMGGLSEERSEPAYPHFAYLLKGIERMVHSGKPAYPVERTLLTAGILDRLLTSKSQQGKRLQTPELAINYAAVDYPHAPHLKLDAPALPD